MVAINQFVILLINGLFYATILYLVGVGITLIYGVLNLVNLAHAVFLAFGAYLSATLINAVAPSSPVVVFLLLLVGSVGIMVAIGAVLERTVFRFLYDIDEDYQILATFGLILIAADILNTVWGGTPVSIDQSLNPSIILGSIDILGNQYPLFNLFAIVLFGVTAAIPFLLLNYTRAGKISLAVSEDEEMAELLGINITRIRMLIFGLAVGLAALGGALLVVTSSASTELATRYIILAFVVVVIGGLGSIKGAIVAAVLVGIIRSFGLAYFPTYEAAIVYVVMAAVILISPKGLKEVLPG